MSSREFTALGSSLPPLRFRIRPSETAFSYLTERMSILIRQVFALDSYGGSIPDTGCCIYINNLITIVYPHPISHPLHPLLARLILRLAWLSFPVHKPPSSLFSFFPSIFDPYRKAIRWCARRYAHPWINPSLARRRAPIVRRPPAAGPSGKRLQPRFQLWSRPYSIRALHIQGQAVAFWTAPTRVNAQVTTIRR